MSDTENTKIALKCQFGICWYFVQNVPPDHLLLHHVEAEAHQGRQQVLSAWLNIFLKSTIVIS